MHRQINRLHKLPNSIGRRTAGTLKYVVRLPFLVNGHPSRNHVVSDNCGGSGIAFAARCYHWCLLCQGDNCPYIHQSCTSAASKVTYDQFELALRAGGLLLILDGFDEIDFTHRDLVSRQILDISTKYPKTIIIVSGRPDDKFSSWHDFHTFTVQALTKPQVIELITKINYDEGLKRRFQSEVERRLYDLHTSFLSSPLLSSIMLLTYEQFAEIPNKMHIFYEQAFAALFVVMMHKRHSSFERPMQT